MLGLLSQPGTPGEARCGQPLNARNGSQTSAIVVAISDLGSGWTYRFGRRTGLGARRAALLGMRKKRRGATTGRAGVSIGLMGSDRTVELADPVDELGVGFDEFDSVLLGSL